MGQTQNSCGFRQVYSFHSLTANSPDQVRTVEVGTMTSHSHLLIEQIVQVRLWHGKMLGDAPAGLPRDCHNITFYYQYYNKQEGQEMWPLWGEKVLISEI